MDTKAASLLDLTDRLNIPKMQLARIAVLLDQHGNTTEALAINTIVDLIESVQYEAFTPNSSAIH